MLLIKPWLPICQLGLLLTLMALSRTAHAHLTTYTGAERSSTVAELRIDADRITLRLEIGDQDREAFAALFQGDAAKSDDGHQGLGLSDDDGMPLAGEVKIMEPRLRTERSTASQPAAGQVQGGSMVTYVEVVYTLTARPAALTLTPPRPDGGDEAAAEIGFIVYHESIPVIDFQYLRRPETLRLDWGDPWYSAFENPELQRHHRAPIMTFLYVEPYEVRFEILIRLKTLASWMALEVQNPMAINADEQARLLERIGPFFLQQNRVRIDGAASRPILDRVQFVKMTPQGIQPLEAAERLTFHTGLAGVILAYITPGPPREVTADWKFFNDRITSVPSTIIDPVSQLPYDLTPAQPRLRWTNMLANYNYRVATIDAIAAQAGNQLDIPWPSMLLGLAAILLFGLGRRLKLKGVYRLSAMALILVTAVVVWPFGRMAVRNPLAPPYELPDVEAILILQGLLQNTYRAFDFRTESDIYDKLAVSVTGDLITDIYLQNRKRLVMEEQGGAQANVQDVQLLDAAQIGPPGKRQRLTFQCTWRITGTVNHWGHTHQRRNQYEAKITIQPVEQTWKLVALDLIDERRLP
ncbi:MAG: hypothetical protein ETSY2_13505 [Candidatus Entotheonella gemina]|uniref:Uncharacterized protein n=1 Tax=Candidatus Entotheonella gemina TaxID=1429439 RepID=W4M9H6_9BACT|nr:MAG: hypothetical protein ETSY2_13505 [Candidatus Entotheonella gemina]